jgi:hypothetical protein
MKVTLLRHIELPFRSVKLTVVLLSLIALTCVVGAAFQHAPLAPADTAGEISRITVASRWFFRLHDIYRSPFFAALLALLAVNVVVCSLHAFRHLTKRNFGWMLTHMSIIVILTGVLIGAVTGDAGVMKVYEGASSATVNRVDGTQFSLGFTIALEEFGIEYYEAPVERLIVFHDGIEHAFPAVVGREYRLRNAAGSVRITDRMPHAATRMRVADTEGGELNPGIRIIVEENDRTAGNWVFAAEEKDTLLFEGALSVRYAWCDTEEAYSRALHDAVSPALETLLARPRDLDTITALPVELGKTFHIDGTDYLVEIIRYLPDFRIDKESGQPISASDDPRNPAIEVKISDGENVATRWVFARFPDFWRLHPDEKDMALELTYFRPADQTIRIVDLDGTRITLVEVRPDQSAEGQTIRIGEPVHLAEGKRTLTIAERVVRPAFAREIVPSLDPQAEPVLQVSIEPQSTATDNSVWLVPNVPHEAGIVQLLYAREFRPRQYSSALTFLEPSGITRQATVRVNAPLRHRGFTFYQSSYGDDGEVFSVLQVRRDPGAPTVYVGFVLLCFGLMYGFYVKPTLLSRLRRKIRDTVPNEE